MRLRVVSATSVELVFADIIREYRLDRFQFKEL